MVLPTWFLIGAPKAGTTALAAMLGEHPEAYVPPQKEVGFFDATWDRGWDWLCAQYEPAGPGRRGGDATPSYLYDGQALDRIAEAVPDARIVVLLREPVARAWSHAWYFRFLGVDPRDPARSLRVELADPTAVVPKLHVSYLGMSTYVRWLPGVVERFGREQVHVEFTEALRADPDGVHARVCEHIGITPTTAPDHEANVGRMARSYGVQRAVHRLGPRLPRGVVRRVARLNQRPGSYPPMPDDLRDRLGDHVAAPNRTLADWLGRDLPSSWSR